MTIKLSGTKTKLFVYFLTTQMLSLTCTILLVNLVNRKNVLIYLKRQDMNDRFRIDNPWSKWRN